MGVGFGLMMLISVAGGAMNEGVGVGGFFVIMGLAFFINGLFEHPGDQFQSAPPRPSPTPVRSARNRRARTSAGVSNQIQRPHP